MAEPGQPVPKAHVFCACLAQRTDVPTCKPMQAGHAVRMQSEVSLAERTGAYQASGRRGRIWTDGEGVTGISGSLSISSQQLVKL